MDAPTRKEIGVLAEDNGSMTIRVSLKYFWNTYYHFHLLLKAIAVHGELAKQTK